MPFKDWLALMESIRSIFLNSSGMEGYGPGNSVIYKAALEALKLAKDITVVYE